MALTYEDLWNKAKTFVERGLAKRDEGAFDQFQLWSSIALEVLGKATLARIHPVLVVNPENFDHLLIACGHKSSTDYKTIMAKTVFERCRVVASNFDNVAKDFCILLGERRNAELHSGEVPFDGIALESWQSKYWQVSKILLIAQGRTLTDYLGHEEAAAAEAVISDATAALRKAVEGRIRKHRSLFEAAHPEAQRIQVGEHAKITVNARLDENQIEHECPACNCLGILSGVFLTQEHLGRVEDEPWLEEYTQSFGAEKFQCIVCGIRLEGVDEVVAAGLPSDFSKAAREEVEYEPDYGND